MRKPRAKRGVQDLSASSEDSGKSSDVRRGSAMAAPERLKRRADFLNAAKGKRFHARGLTLQAVPRRTPVSALPTEASPRFGFTVTKKCGGAVQRNRIRRRLKEALRLLKPLPARPGNDYVILARPEALGMSFPALQGELSRALGKIETRKNLPPIRHDRDPKDHAGGSDDAWRKGSIGRTPTG